MKRRWSRNEGSGQHGKSLATTHEEEEAVGPKCEEVRGEEWRRGHDKEKKKCRYGQKR